MGVMPWRGDEAMIWKAAGEGMPLLHIVARKPFSEVPLDELFYRLVARYNSH